MDVIVRLTRSFPNTQAYGEFNAYLDKLASAAQPLLDAPPVDIIGLTSGSLRTRITAAKTLMPLVKCGTLPSDALSTATIIYCPN